MTGLFHVTSALNRDSILANGPADEPAPASPRGRHKKQRKKKPRAGP
jgi:hypothetical protein